MGLIPDGKELSTDLAQPAIKQAQTAMDEAVDRAGMAMSADATQALSRIAEISQSLLNGIGFLLHAEIGNLQQTVASLDGWTLTISPITLTLKRPPDSK